MERDYTLYDVACVVYAWGHETSVVGDDIVCDGTVYPMEGTRWLEMGHQHSDHKQWWPQ